MSDFNNAMMNRIKETLDATGHNNRWLALQTEITECNLSLYFTGKRNPGIDNLAKMCKALNISADWVLGLKESPKLN